MVAPYQCRWCGSLGFLQQLRSSAKTGNPSGAASACIGRQSTKTFRSPVSYSLRNLCGWLTPISPPRVKGVDLLRPVVVVSPNATAEFIPVAFSFSAVFVSSAGTASRTRYPTPIEAQPSRREGREVCLSRPRNSFGPSYRPPHDERRRVCASVIARLGGGAAHPVNAYVVGKRAGVPSNALAAGPLAHDRRLVALCGARVVTIGDELGPDGLELAIWLARALPVTPRGTSPLRRPSLARACKTPLARSCGRESTGPSLCRVCVRSVSGSSSRSRHAGETARRLRRTPI